jgi:proteic killer suppression protein
MLLSLLVTKQMIQTLRCKDTRDLFEVKSVCRFVNIQAVVMRKLAMLNRSATVDDLKVPPGNRLELLSGDRAGQYSIRINAQWRLCFSWTGRDAQDVELVDYQ